MQSLPQMSSPQEMVDDVQVESSAPQDDFETMPKNNASNRDTCPSRRSRGIVWPVTGIGAVARRPCPAGTEMGQASWECNLGPNDEPTWKSQFPDLTGYRKFYFSMRHNRFKVLELA